MARPSNPIILQNTNADNDLDVLAAPGLWIVEYDKQSIALRQSYYSPRGIMFKYLRTAFSNPAHAYKLAKKLNLRFNTTLFTVKEQK